MQKVKKIYNSNKYYLGKRWLDPFTKLFHNDKVLNVTLNTIQSAINYWSNNVKENIWRFLWNKTRRLSPINQYMEPILQLYLAELDERSFDLSLRAKYIA